MVIETKLIVNLENLAKCKKLAKSKMLGFAKAYFSATTFFTAKTRLAFTQLRQAFTKAPILHNFYSDCHIFIKADTSWYAIGTFPSQLIPDQHSSHHITFENLNFSKSNISQ